LKHLLLWQAMLLLRLLLLKLPQLLLLQRVWQLSRFHARSAWTVSTRYQRRRTQG
jgi:hypothetical protein